MSNLPPREQDTLVQIHDILTNAAGDAEIIPAQVPLVPAPEQRVAGQPPAPTQRVPGSEEVPRRRSPRLNPLAAAASCLPTVFTGTPAAINKALAAAASCLSTVFNSTPAAINKAVSYLTQTAAEGLANFTRQHTAVASSSMEVWYTPPKGGGLPLEHTDVGNCFLADGSI